MEHGFDKEIDWKQAKAMTGKVVIPECMEEIRDRLFSGNKGITAVVIPGTVKKIGELAFSNCENLEEVLLEEGIEEIGRNAFSGTKIRNLACPDSIRVYNGQAFQGLRLDAPVMNVSKTILVGVTGNLTGESYSVPDGIKGIGPDAFFLQKDLKEIRIPDSLRRIQGRAFVDCGLREVTIPASVRSIDSKAFSNCESLETVTILNPDARVQSGAFISCGALKEIRWEGKQSVIQDFHLRGIPFLDANGRLPEANLEHALEERFQLLSKICGEGDADAMEAMAEFFERWSANPGASAFYMRAANYWHFRAYSKGQPEAVQWIEHWISEHPGQRLPAMLREDVYVRMGISGLSSGASLNALGFSFFDPERSYSLEALPGTGLIQVSSYESEDGPDEDGFGREEYYDWWYLDENLQAIPGIDWIHSFSYLDKRNHTKKFNELIAAASETVRAKKQTVCREEVPYNSDTALGNAVDFPGDEPHHNPGDWEKGTHLKPAFADGWDNVRIIPDDILRLNPPDDFIRFYEVYDGGECRMGPSNYLTLYALHTQRERSKALIGAVVSLQEEWEDWWPEAEEDAKALLDETLIVGKYGSINDTKPSASNYIVYLKGRFYIAPFMKMLIAFHAPECFENVLYRSSAETEFLEILQRVCIQWSI